MEQKTDVLKLMMKRTHSVTPKVNQYEGITHEIPDYFIKDERFCKVWKEKKCSKCIHAFNEEWSEGEHYLSCDICNLIVYIDRIDKSWVEDD